MTRWLFIVSAILMVLVKAQPARAVQYGDNSYFEVCLSERNECVLGSFSKYGDFVVLIREGKHLPGISLGDVIKPGPLGDHVAIIREPIYQAIMSMGIERIFIDPNNIQPELNKIQSDLDYNLFKCVSGVLFGCGGGTMAVLGSGGWALALAGYACYQSYTNCEDLDKANQDLFARRKALEKRLKEEAEKENGSRESSADSGASGGHGGEGGHPSPGPGGAYYPPSGPGAGHGGVVSGSEGGSGTLHPIVFN